ncbi:MAG TPA: pyridoxamine 5'-phosphate oxidase family protein [Solirubrobacteraceae bacterium]|nr:pyridoxamine 5'-phosphate oxidase family protein [Solirubrobacteraceae bacterium]
MSAARPDSTPPRGARTRLLRMPERGAHDRATIEAILDEALVSHVGFALDGRPFVIPTLHARLGDRVYFHGSAASRTLRALAAGAEMCLTATLLDGVVLARSAVHQSVNYRAAMVFGQARATADEEEKRAAIEAFSERLIPGRWPEVRPPTDKELKAIDVLSLPLDEASAKLRTGGPKDNEEDYSREGWAGVIPVGLTAGEPLADERLAPGTEPSQAILAWRPDGSRHDFHAK